MKELISEINRWQAENVPLALATVVQTWGSAPRKVGGKMALTADGRIAGSVSGGCVEGAVVEEGTAVLQTNQTQAATLWRRPTKPPGTWGWPAAARLKIFVEPLDTAVTQFIQNSHPKRSIRWQRSPLFVGQKNCWGASWLLASAGEQLGTLGNATLDKLAIAAEAKASQPERTAAHGTKLKFSSTPCAPPRR